MIALSDRQMQVVTTAAANVPHEKRSLFLERLAALMQFRPRTDQDVADAACWQLSVSPGKVHQPRRSSHFASMARAFASACESLPIICV